MRVVLEVIGALILLWILAFGFLRVADGFRLMMRDRAQRGDRAKEDEES